MNYMSSLGEILTSCGCLFQALVFKVLKITRCLLTLI